ncbi:MAG: DNA phosphorothioation-associated putative methyltransferase [Acidobacteria bacterium]|nr:DNA phosphorothioation-associated putative methyltransferase [Acidobacteriota bacterium]
MSIAVQRHKTAIKRNQLSRPLQLSVEQGIVTEHTTVLDYGCGRGDDVRLLNQKGISATGWDPIHRPGKTRTPADVVNLGYVVNVIEQAQERVRALRDAWALTQKVLIVSARLSIQANHQLRSTPYADGCLTARGTFQKYYDQVELRDWVNSTLQVESIAAGPGIFFVFKDTELHQSFQAQRFRRRAIVPTGRFSNRIFDENRTLLEALAGFITIRGRIPDRSEFDSADSLIERVGSLQRAFRIIQRVTGSEQWERIQAEKSEDLLVYLALSRFGSRPIFSDLPRDLQLDIRLFFGSYRRACDLADDLLFSAGRTEVISKACQASPVGKLLADALYVHSSALPLLPSVLRVYEGCARAYVGTVENANVIKLKIGKPQISYLYYPDFEKHPHPALAGSLVVPLNTFRIKYREYSDSSNPFILHRKETLIARDHPLRDRFERLTKQEERAGLYEESAVIGTKEGWESQLKMKGVSYSGHRLIKCGSAR